MNKLTFSALIVSSALLTACGSGGGGSADVPETAPSLQPKPQLSSTIVNGVTLPDLIHKATLSDGSKNADVEISKNSYQKGSIVRASVTDANGRDAGKLTGYNRDYVMTGVIEITDGRRTVTQQLIASQGNASKLGTEANRSALTAQGMRGELLNTWVPLSNSHSVDAFVMGYVTPDTGIPTQGIVTYKGGATTYDKVSASVRHIGETTLRADFANKKIWGAIKTDNFRPNIRLEETGITAATRQEGNTATNGSATETNTTVSSASVTHFSGKAVAEGNNLFQEKSGTYSGAFYGPNAEEAAGTANINGEAPTVFNTVKQ